MELEQEINEQLTNDTSELSDTSQENEQIDDTSEQSEISQAMWETHEQAKKGFWKSADDAVKGYDYLNNQVQSFKPLQTQLNQRGIKDLDGLTEILTKYDEYSDPNSERNLTINALENLLAHPEYGKSFNEWAAKIIEQEETARYGFRLTPEMRQQQQELDQLKNWKQQVEQEKQQGELSGQIEQNCTQIEEFCKNKGIEFSEDDMKEFLLYCHDNKVGINNMFDKFISLNIDKITGNIQQKASKAVVSNIQNNAKAAVASANDRKQPTNNGVPTNRDDFRNVLLEQFNSSSS